jgi:acetyl/propionyl-CoA carboxylase alpha subunit
MRKVFIANRGEIAVRIRRACDALGLESVQAASDPDKSGFAARGAHEVAEIGGSTARDSYLNMDSLITAARRHGCDSLHPGYGFLSESAEFARRVLDSGLIWIGPRPRCIEALGHKTEARRLARQAGVPTTEGSVDAYTDGELADQAIKGHFPLIIKASAGGGGRGMRIVWTVEEFQEALPRARAEALKNFGNDAVYFERYVERPRHVEVQIFGDNHGQVRHFGTRECSTQRRYQKLIEEGPAPLLSPEMRERIHAAAIRAAASVGYNNAGTAEFLVKGDEFYFLEINTRIQVEHPVTEMITGVDLVQLQLRIAMGEAMPYHQDEITVSGHAIELRINAEDVRENFRPVTGKIERFPDSLSEPWLRDERGYEDGDSVSPFYDSLLSKIIVHGKDRDEALYRAFTAVQSYSVHGIETSLPFHRWMLCTKEFQDGGIDIGFVEREFSLASLREFEALPRPNPHTDGQFNECKFYHDHGSEIVVRVTEEPGGTFLAVPQRNGVPDDDPQWRRGISARAAFEAVIGKERQKLVGN